MTIFVGLDVHRAQITYDALDTDSGEVRTGRIRTANRATVRTFLVRLATKETIVAVEAMTGWRFIAEECARAGIDVRLAEPAETRMRQDRKRRAKTDKLDARLLRELLMQERLPESWIAPGHILDLRAKVRLRKALVDQRTEWLQRIHAVLFHHGVPVQPGRLARLDARDATRLPSADGPLRHRSARRDRDPRRARRHTAPDVLQASGALRRTGHHRA